MKYHFLLLLLFGAWALCAQQTPDTRPKIKTLLTQSSKAGSFYVEYSPDGVPVFDKLDGLNGNPAMLYAAEYDTLKRELKSWSAHENLGLFISETAYEKDRILHYSYAPDSMLKQAFDGNALHDINSREAFLHMEGMKAQASRPRYLSGIDLLDSAGHVVAEIHLSEKGDTSAVDTYEYNEKGLQVLFHYNVGSTDVWAWDIYKQYNDQDQLVLSYRIPRQNGGRDTTEVRTYTYNQQHKRLSEAYYDHKSFVNRTDYVYDKNNRLKAEYFYERKEHRPDVITTYIHNDAGYIAQETQINFRESKKQRKEVIRYWYTYW